MTAYTATFTKPYKPDNLKIICSHNTWDVPFCDLILLNEAPSITTDFEVLPFELLPHLNEHTEFLKYVAEKTDEVYATSFEFSDKSSWISRLEVTVKDEYIEEWMNPLDTWVYTTPAELEALNKWRQGLGLSDYLDIFPRLPPEYDPSRFGRQKNVGSGPSSSCKGYAGAVPSLGAPRTEIYV